MAVWFEEFEGAICTVVGVARDEGLPVRIRGTLTVCGTVTVRLATANPTEDSEEGFESYQNEIVTQISFMYTCIITLLCILCVDLQTNTHTHKYVHPCTYACIPHT